MLKICATAVCKSLASAVEEILKGKPLISGSFPSPGQHPLFFLWDLMMGLGKPQLQSKFEVAGFIYYGNIRKSVFKWQIRFWATLWGSWGYRIWTSSIDRWKARSRLPIRDNWTDFAMSWWPTKITKWSKWTSTVDTEMVAWFKCKNVKWSPLEEMSIRTMYIYKQRRCRQGPRCDVWWKAKLYRTYTL